MNSFRSGPLWSLTPNPPKNIPQLFFHEESINEVSKRYLDPPYIHTDKPNPICRHVLKVGGIIMKTSEIKEKTQKNLGGYTYEMTHTSTANFPKLQSFAPNEC